jgi:hypothetical protein
MVTGMGKPKIKCCPTFTLCTKNPTYTRLGLNLRLRGLLHIVHPVIHYSIAVDTEELFSK